MLYVNLSNGRGRGVFAKHFIQPFTVLDNSYSWMLSPEDLLYYDKTSVGGHWFDVPGVPGYGLLPLGLAALVNHSNNPNASLVWKHSNIGFIGTLTSIRNISVDEEIFIDYRIVAPDHWC